MLNFRRAPARLVLTGTSSIALALCATTASGDPEIASADLVGLVAYPLVEDARAFAVGGVWCNLGPTPAPWNALTAQHPVTATNLLRVSGGRLEQIGASWAWHHGCPLQTNACGTCQPEPGPCPVALGSGCSTTSTASALGTQAQLAPRSQIDASAAAFPYPFQAPPTSSSLSRRCIVSVADLDPREHPEALYAFHTVTLYAQAASPLSGSVLRSVLPEPLAQGAGGAFDGPAESGVSALDFWRAVHDDVALLDLELDGLVRVGVRVVAAEGVWHYEFAVENLNSHEAVSALNIPLRGATASDLRFAAPLPHSGEVTSAAPWTAAVGDELVWSTSTFAQDPLANAIRWGTVYSFGFTSDRPPAPSTVLLRTFRNADTLELALPAPAARSDLNLDGVVGAADLAILLGAWGRCAACAADLNGDGSVGSADLGLLLGEWTN